MTDIDWRKAPEGATHALSTGPKWDGSPSLIGTIRFAVKRGRSYVEASDHDGVTFCMGKKSWVVVAERRTSWPGEGLPPVGTVCEVDYCEQWQRCEIIAHFQQRCGMVAAFTVETGNGVKHLDAFAESAFRPTRTPEQIAAEEREKAIIEIARAIMPGQVCAGPEDMKRAVRLYRAGYRKQEAV